MTKKIIMQHSISKIHEHKPIEITNDIKKFEVMNKNPRTDYGLPISLWPLYVLTRFITKEKS